MRGRVARRELALILFSIVPVPELYGTGTSAVEAKHPIASAELPSLQVGSASAGAAGSVGGLLSAGGAWVSFPRGGASLGLNPPILQDTLPQKLFSDLTGTSALVPELPAAVWGRMSTSIIDVGLSTRYGYRRETSEIGGESIDESVSEGASVSLGAGRTCSDRFRLDTSVGWSVIRASIAQGSFVGEGTDRRLRFPALFSGSVRGDWNTGDAAWVPFVSAAVGAGEIDGVDRSIVTYTTGLFWSGAVFSESPAALLVGGSLTGWHWAVRESALELHQAVRVPLGSAHGVMVGAVENLAVNEHSDLRFGRSLRVGYAFERNRIRLEVAADVESLPDLIIFGARLDF